jgi:hypothetical protein
MLVAPEPFAKRCTVESRGGINIIVILTVVKGRWGNGDVRWICMGVAVVVQIRDLEK